MQLIDQHTKKIMEGCKERALDAGLRFDKETLEYIVTNTDMVELSPKNMIPTLYDYWLQDLQVLRGKGEYEYYPHNPYETVINTRPAISFYNDNNPDWLNVMIFYHVIAHIDFFQNNKYYQRTWDYDFKEKALTEKRIIAKLRSKKGRVVDYVIEFARSIDNLVGYFNNLSNSDDYKIFKLPDKIDFYFNVFLQSIKNVGQREFLAEIDRYNLLEDTPEKSKEEQFFLYIKDRNPEYEEIFENSNKGEKKIFGKDFIQFIMEESGFLNNPDNIWMKSVIEIVRDTALYFSPQIRTKTMNEGWASYWHEKLFMNDERIKGYEVAFARINAKVTAISKIGLNPYAIGLRLYSHIEEMADKGRYSYDFRKILDFDGRDKFDSKKMNGKDFIFHVRQNYSDTTFLSAFIDQDFVDKHKLMVVGQRINPTRYVKEYYVKSRKAADYKGMVMESLFHPPYINFSKKNDGTLSLEHRWEGKELFRDYISNTLIGIEYLWGDRVELDTIEIDWDEMKKKYDLKDTTAGQTTEKVEPIYRNVKYSVQNKKVHKQIIIKSA